MNSDNFDSKKKQYEYKSLVRNSFYSYFRTYSSFFFSMIHAFLLARLISKTEWSYYIIAISYINIIILIVNFIPPGMEKALDYYLTRYYSLNKKTRLKQIFYSSFIIKTIILIPTFFISILVFYFLGDFFAINLKSDNILLLFILSPLILIKGIDVLFNSMNRSFNNFKLLFYLLIIQSSTDIGFLLLFFVSDLKINVYLVTLIYLLTNLFPFILNVIVNVKKITKIKETEKQSKLLKKNVQKLYKYGSKARLGYFITDMWGQIQIQSISIFEPEELVLGFSIASRYLTISTNMTISISSPLTISFSRLVAQKKEDMIIKVYNLLVKYSLFLLLLITGILFLFTDFFLYFLYGESYLIYSEIVKVYLFSFIFLVFSAPFDSLMLARNKLKYFNILRFFALSVRLPLFLVFLIVYGLLPSLYALVIFNFIYGCLYVIFTKRFGNIKLDIKKIAFQYFSFFGALAITIFLQFLILDKLNYTILNNLNLLYFRYLNIFTIILFPIIFFLLIILLKVLTKEDVENIQSLLIKENRLHRITNKALNILKKCLRN